MGNFKGSWLIAGISTIAITAMAVVAMCSLRTPNRSYCKLGGSNNE